jgi:hypothetical protein
MAFIFTDADEMMMEERGLTSDKVLIQLEAFRKGITYKTLLRPCKIGDGILAVPGEEEADILKHFEAAAGEGRFTKFVPASGAATRMFRDWSSFLERQCPEHSLQEFLSSLSLYPFYEDVRKAAARNGIDLESLIQKKEIKQILRFILTPAGLDYGSLPKALILFHSYTECPRTSLEEHLVEGALYARDNQGISRIHITVSPEHEVRVREHLDIIRTFYEKLFGIKFHLTLSTQRHSTDVIAVNLQDEPVRGPGGKLVFRPGGHGALLSNLNSIVGDIIFIKNIDNVVKDALKPVTIHYKKLLGGYLVKIQRQVFDYLKKLSAKSNKDEAFPVLLESCVEFCRDKLNISTPPDWHEYGTDRKRDYLFGMMNRPIRVCGMVRNEGEPGGGPFWVEDNKGGESLQIIEEAQVDCSDSWQVRIWKEAAYFNPVDLVCAVRDYQGKKFDLGRFVDQDAFFISRKTQDNQEIKALELPGLWNGSMAFWTTIFIEVPIETFNPVKEVKDLLRAPHKN